MAWLIWWAKLAKQENAMQSWRDFDENENLREEFLDIYTRIDKTKAADTRKRLNSGDSNDPKGFFEQNNSKLKKTLTDQLGPAAHHYYPHPGKKHDKTKYGLTIAPENITLDLD